MDEIWKDIKGFEGYYQISNFGKVKSLDRVIIKNDGKKLTLKSKLLCPCGDGLGYFHVTLSILGKTYCKKIHRLIAEAFIPNPYNKPYINHKDGNGGNNEISNLEWCTQSENVRHAINMGLTTFKCGEAHSMCKLSDDEVLKIRKLRNEYGLSQRELGIIFLVSQAHIYDILHRNNRTKNSSKEELL